MVMKRTMKYKRKKGALSAQRNNNVDVVDADATTKKENWSKVLHEWLPELTRVKKWTFNTQCALFLPLLSL